VADNPAPDSAPTLTGMIFICNLLIWRGFWWYRTLVRLWESDSSLNLSIHDKGCWRFEHFCLDFSRIVARMNVVVFTGSSRLLIGWAQCDGQRNTNNANSITIFRHNISINTTLPSFYLFLCVSLTVTSRSTTQLPRWPYKSDSIHSRILF